MEFSRQEYWSELPWPPPRDLPDPETEPSSPALAGSSLPLVPPKRSVELSKLFKLVTKLPLLPYSNQRWTCVELQKDFSAFWLPLFGILKADNSYKADLMIQSRGPRISFIDSLSSHLFYFVAVCAYRHVLLPVLGDIKARWWIRNHPKQLSPTTYDANSKSRPWVPVGALFHHSTCFSQWALGWWKVLW